MNNKELALYGSQLPLGSIDAYISRVNSIPMLSREEELLLSNRLRETGDLAAAERLVVSHLRYVVRVAKGYMGYGLQLADLVQEGTVGLMKAVKRFEPDQGVRLVSFAVHWIKSEIHEFIIRNWRMVKIATTKAQRKLFFNLRNSKQRLGWFTKEEVAAVAHDLGVKPEEVLHMEKRLNASDVSFDLSIDDTNDKQMALPPAEYLEASEAFDPALKLEQENWSIEVKQRFSGAFASLDDRSKNILQKRWLTEEKPVTLRELSDVYGVSTERVRQLEKNAIAKLKEAIVH